MSSSWYRLMSYGSMAIRTRGCKTSIPAKRITHNSSSHIHSTNLLYNTAKCAADAKYATSIRHAGTHIPCQRKSSNVVTLGANSVRTIRGAALRAGRPVGSTDSLPNNTHPKFVSFARLVFGHRAIEDAI